MFIAPPPPGLSSVGSPSAPQFLRTAKPPRERIKPAEEISAAVPVAERKHPAVNEMQKPPEALPGNCPASPGNTVN